MGKVGNIETDSHRWGQAIQVQRSRQIAKETGQMFFNGFTLLLMMISAIGGLWLGVKIENAHHFRLRDEWLNGETIENQMKRDGWSL